MEKEKEFYNEVKNWDFSMFHIDEESLTDWNLYELLRKNSTKNSKILDLGTGGGENLLAYFPEAKEILGTDYSEKMIKTAKQNLKKSGRKNIKFKVMNNLNMTTRDNYYDIVVARNTVSDPNQIYKTLNSNGLLLIHGVDKLDCFDLKILFGKGQGYNDIKSMSQVDYENVIKAGFKKVELVPIYKREYFKTYDEFYHFIMKVPIIEGFSEKILM